MASMSGQGSKNQLIVRNLEEEVVRELKLRAAQAWPLGRGGAPGDPSPGASSSQKAKRSLKDLLLAMPAEGDDDDFTRTRD